jgi:hypothetical protein
MLVLSLDRAGGILGALIYSAELQLGDPVGRQRQGKALFKEVFPLD